MTDLERRALMGDKQAQEECTAKGIVLPCPCCGSTKVVPTDDLETFVWLRCTLCGHLSKTEIDERAALQSWNTRTPPPIGRCGTCKNRSTLSGWENRCDALRLITEDDFYCQFYRQKEES